MQTSSTCGPCANVGLFAAIATLTSIGCTALGPMPATTAASATPAGRPSFDAQIAAVPGYYLSSGVSSDPKGAGITQAAVLVEPDDIIHVPGLVVGGRYVGDSSKGGYPEPMVGYRAFLDGERRLAVDAMGYAAHGSGSAKGASYSATRGGAEAGLDFRATPANEYFEVHLLASASLTGVRAEGTYCIDTQTTFGIDCPDKMPVYQHAVASGFYPAATGGVSFDMGRHLNGEFHGGRVELLVGGGTMPRVVGGEQQGVKSYASAGLALGVAFGEAAKLGD